MPRHCSGGVIEEFCKYCEKTEVPSTFALWCGIFLASEALGRDCFIDQGYFVVYPNMYVILVAGSAKCRKSTAINLTTDFLRKIEPPIKILSQKLTPEAMISALSGIKIKDTTKIIDEAVGCFINDELSTLIDRNTFASALIPVLTKLYDCKDFEYETKARGAESIKNPCLSVLGGSTIQWIKEAIPVHSIGGGFTSRIVFVFRASRERKIAWPQKSDENAKREILIVKDLNEIRQMRGQFGVTREAIDMFTEEYEAFLDGPMSMNPYLAGYAGRRHVTLLKTAMAFAASRSSEREINDGDMLKALKSLRSVEGGMDIVMKSITMEPIGDISEQVMALIMCGGSITRAKLIREVRHRISIRELDVILEALIEAELVKKGAKNGSVVYIYERKERNHQPLQFTL